MNLKYLTVLGSSAILVGFLGGYGLAPATAQTPGHPGYQYGGTNCGCYNYNCDSLDCCYNCCAGADALDANGKLNCQKFCDQAVFPCQTANCDPASVEPCDDDL